jgi:hypothetical protein
MDIDYWFTRKFSEWTMGDNVPIGIKALSVAGLNEWIRWMLNHGFADPSAPLEDSRDVKDTWFVGETPSWFPANWRELLTI